MKCTIFTLFLNLSFAFAQGGQNDFKESRIIQLDPAFPVYTVLGGYNWLSDSRVIYVVAGLTNDQFIINDYRNTTNLDWKIQKLNDTLNALGQASLDWFLSPDRSKILVTAASNTGSADFVADLKNGEVISTCIPLKGYRFVWLPNSAGWIELFYRHSYTVMRVFKSTPTNYFNQVEIPGLVGTPVGFNRNWNLLSVVSSGSSNSLFLVEWHLSSTPQILRKIKLLMPPHLIVKEVIVSPSENELAWLFVASDQQKRNSAEPDARIYSVWVSDISGNGFNRVGSVSDSDIRCLRYKPNGRDLSFCSDHGLYLLNPLFETTNSPATLIEPTSQPKHHQ
jgi:hypothetical protein